MAVLPFAQPSGRRRRRSTASFRLVVLNYTPVCLLPRLDGDKDDGNVSDPGDGEDTGDGADDFHFVDLGLHTVTRTS